MTILLTLHNQWRHKNAIFVASTRAPQNRTASDWKLELKQNRNLAYPTKHLTFEISQICNFQLNERKLPLNTTGWAAKFTTGHSMMNQAAVEALYSATFAEDYLDVVENLPNELQRHLSRLREHDLAQYREEIQ